MAKKSLRAAGHPVFSTWLNHIEPRFRRERAITKDLWISWMNTPLATGQDPHTLQVLEKGTSMDWSQGKSTPEIIGVPNQYTLQ